MRRRPPASRGICLSANVGSVVDTKTVMANQANGDLGNTWLKNHTAGAGPYKLTEWAASNHVIIDTNPNAAEKALMRRIVIRHVADPSAQLLQLEKGDVDIARDLGADQLKSIAGNKSLMIAAASTGTSMDMAMNQAMPQLQKVEVHQAIKNAIDYEATAGVRRHHPPRREVAVRLFRGYGSQDHGDFAQGVRRRLPGDVR